MGRTMIRGGFSSVGHTFLPHITYHNILVGTYLGMLTHNEDREERVYVWPL
jgi:hypothetical protein